MAKHFTSIWIRILIEGGLQCKLWIKNHYDFIIPPDMSNLERVRQCVVAEVTNSTGHWTLARAGLYSFQEHPGVRVSSPSLLTCHMFYLHSPQIDHSSWVINQEKGSWIISNYEEGLWIMDNGSMNLKFIGLYMVIPKNVNAVS